MPVTFDQTLQYAQTQKETAPVYIHDQTSTVDGQSQTQGLAKLFGSEKAAAGQRLTHAIDTAE